MGPSRINGCLKVTRIQPGAITPVDPVPFVSNSGFSGHLLSLVNKPAISFNSHNPFSVLPEVALPAVESNSPFPTKSAHRRLKHRLRSCRALQISSISISGDLGSEEPLTLPAIIRQSAIVNANKLDFDLEPELVPANLMIDSGASSQFIDREYAEKHNLTLTLKNKPENLILADGKASIVGQITHTCTLRLAIDQHMEDLVFHITKLSGWDIIVGKP